MSSKVIAAAAVLAASVHTEKNRSFPRSSLQRLVSIE